MLFKHFFNKKSVWAFLQTSAEMIFSCIGFLKWYGKLKNKEKMGMRRRRNEMQNNKIIRNPEDKEITVSILIEF